MSEDVVSLPVVQYFEKKNNVSLDPEKSILPPRSDGNLSSTRSSSVPWFLITGVVDNVDFLSSSNASLL